MAIRHISELVTKNSNTYADVAAFQAEHGPVGGENANVQSVSFEVLAGGNGVRRTCVFTDTAQMDAFFPQLANADASKTFTATRTSLENI